MWLEKLERTLRPTETAQLREWLKVRLHREVIVERCKLWHGPEILAVLNELFVVEEATPAARPYKRLVKMFLAAGAAVAMVTFAFYAAEGRLPGTEVPHGPSIVDKIYRAPIGARQEVTLPDGSTISLNTNTRVVVRYGPRFRDMFLVDGEASFYIAKDTRPLVLAVGKRYLEGENNRFNLRRLSPDQAELTVTEGTVKLRKGRPVRSADLGEEHSDDEATVRALEGGIVADGWHSIRRLDLHEIETRLAWRKGVILFTDEPLESALAEVERYTLKRFVLADDALRNVRLSGEFRTGDVEGVLQALRSNFRIESRAEGERRIVLMARSGPPPL